MGEKTMKIKGAIFDMDGTLVDSLMLWDVMWEHFGKRYRNIDGFRPDAAFDRSMRTIVLRDAMVCVHETFGFGRDGESLLAEANAILLDFYRNRVEMKPGARAFLDRLREKGIPMCLASATDPMLIEPGLERCDMNKYFKAVLSCATIGKGKEAPDIYLEAQRILGTPAEETWVFEDSYVALRTAHSIGMPTVGIYDKYNDFDHDKLEALSDIYIGKGRRLTEIEV